MIGKLIFKDGETFEGKSFGAEKSIAGEMVFATGMTGYPEAFTDPSFAGQILILTYPLIGNYGVPDKKFWESHKMHIAGLIVSTYNDTPSHFQSKMTLADWLVESNVPALEIKDTRYLAQKLRDGGAMLGKIELTEKVDWHDPNVDNLVANVSTKEVIDEAPLRQGFAGQGKTIVLIDCGAKNNIRRSLVSRGVRVIQVPWDFDPFENIISNAVRDPKGDFSATPRNNNGLWFDGILISNGPGDPKMADKTILTIQKALDKKVPTLGICLGNQLLALAAGGNTSKLKFGHRSQNQPCLEVGTERCYITTQNHGFHVSDIPNGFREWFKNANDGSNEGLMHEKLPFMSVQFHPESTPGPFDTEWIFDNFLERIP